MAEEVWINPNNSKDRRRISSKITPPRQAGTNNISAGSAQVPSGFVKQNGNDGFMDVNFYLQGQAVPNYTIAGYPYYVGIVYPALGYDPLAGQPWHTRPSLDLARGEYIPVVAPVPPPPPGGGGADPLIWDGGRWDVNIWGV